jgi:hypothetical protein
MLNGNSLTLLAVILVHFDAAEIQKSPDFPMVCRFSSGVKSGVTRDAKMTPVLTPAAVQNPANALPRLLPPPWTPITNQPSTTNY